MSFEAQNFYLNGLDMSADSAQGLLAGGATNPFTGDANATIDVSLNLLKDIFKFQSDSVDICNNVLSDVKYKVVDPSNSWVYSPADAVVDANPIRNGATEQKVQYDFVRHLAKSLFGTDLGVDLFTNEEELRSHLVTESLSALKARFTALAGLGDLDDEDVEQDGVQINPSRQILRQIIHNDPDRLGNAYVDGDADGNGFFKMPLIAGDALYFVFTANAHADQSDVVNDAVSNPPARSYLIKMNVVA